MNIASMQLWVHDQDEALAFWTEKVGMEIRSDVTMPEMVEQINALTSKGAGATVFLTTEDCRADYEQLKGRGVEFVEAPEERPYGIDAGFRDPSGNHIRLTQVTMAGV